MDFVYEMQVSSIKYRRQTGSYKIFLTTIKAEPVFKNRIDNVADDRNDF